MRSQHPHLTGYLYAFAAAFFFAFIGIIGKGLLSGGLVPLELMFYQFGIAAVVVSSWVLITKPKELIVTRKTFGLLSLQALIGSFGTNFFFYAALETMNAGMASMLLFMNPIVVTMFFSITGIRKLKLSHYLAVALALMGSILVLGVFESITFSNISPYGVIMGLLSCVCYGFFNVFADLKLQHVRPVIINVYSSLIGFSTSVIAMALMGIPYRLLTDQIPGLLILTICSSILPVICLFQALKRIGSEKVTVVATIELPITLVLAFFILHESLSLLQMLGVISIISATYLIFNSKGDKESFIRHQ